MSAYVLDANATVLCQHAGNARAVATNTRVKLGGQAVLTQTDTHAVSGCSFTKGPVYTPCVTVRWLSAATRVKAGGMPVLVRDSQATCIPNGTGVNVLVTQMRVKAM